VYTKPIRQKILKTDISIIPDWDVFTNYYITRYCYRIPLCYQLFPETDNQKYWGIHNPILYFLSSLSVYLIQFLELDRKPEPGFAFFYYLSAIPLYIILLLVVLALFFMISSTGLQSYRKYKMQDVLQKIKAKWPWIHSKSS